MHFPRRPSITLPTGRHMSQERWNLESTYDPAQRLLMISFLKYFIRYFAWTGIFLSPPPSDSTSQSSSLPAYSAMSCPRYGAPNSGPLRQVPFSHPVTFRPSNFCFDFTLKLGHLSSQLPWVKVLPQTFTVWFMLIGVLSSVFLKSTMILKGGPGRNGSAVGVRIERNSECVMKVFAQRTAYEGMLHSLRTLRFCLKVCAL